ncbi:MAG: glycosyltransferase [Candidatus Nanopelagicales bacterium]
MGEQSRLVSVVIPVCGTEPTEYLQATLESVLAQDYERLECLLVAPEPKTAIEDRVAAGQQVPPGRLRGIVATPSARQAALVNQGLRECAGDLITVVIPGDLLLPGFLATLAGDWPGDPAVVLAYPDFRLISAQGATLAEFKLPELSHEQALNWQVSVEVGALFSRRLITELGGWDEHFEVLPDLDFQTRGRLHGSYVHVPRLLAARRLPLQTPPEGVGADLAERTQILDRLLESHPERVGIAMNEATARSTALFQAAILTSPAMNGSSERYEIRDRHYELAVGAAAPAAVELEQLRARLAAQDGELAAERRHSSALATLAEARAAEVTSAMSQIAAASADAEVVARTITGLERAVEEAYAKYNADLTTGQEHSAKQAAELMKQAETIYRQTPLLAQQAERIEEQAAHLATLTNRIEELERELDAASDELSKLRGKPAKRFGRG